MSDQFYGEIRIFAGFGGQSSISGWAMCIGTTLLIDDYPQLYSLIGITYGGDGSSNFIIPDMRGRIAVGQGTGTGLTTRIIGSVFGSDTVTLTEDELPSHKHPFQAVEEDATSNDPQGMIPAKTTGTLCLYDDEEGSASINALAPSMIQITGGGDSHDNCMPTLALSYLIALKGVYPNRP